MINKIKATLLTVMTLLTFAAPALVPSAVASAECGNIAKQIYSGAKSASSETSGDCGASDAEGTTKIREASKKVVNIFSLIVGIAAVIMIIFGGFRYITSGGDSGKVGNAKNSLIYAIVGLVVVALAQVIVRFVLSQTADIAN